MKTSILHAFLVTVFSFVALSFSVKAQPTPVVCMPFSMDALDISGNNHHGFVTGATLTTDRFGNPNSAFDFDGVDDQIEISGPLSSYLPGDDVTIIFWARANAVMHNSPFLLIPDDLSDRLNISIHYDHNGTPFTFWDYGDIFAAGRLDGATPFQNTWDHYAFIVNSAADSMMVYKNGVLLLSQQGTSPIVDKTRSLYIGGGMAGAATLYFEGEIDDVQIFDIALSETEVSDNYINSNSCVSSVQNLMSGKIFYDPNTNGIQDAGEVGLSSTAITEINSGRTCFSFSDGSFIMGIDSTGSYEISPVLSLPYYAAVPLTHTASFATLGEVDSLNDFPLQPLGQFNDLKIFMTAMGPIRPGFISTYKLHYENVGTTTIGGDVIFFPDSLVTYDDATVTPASVTTDSIVWNISPLLPFESGDIFVDVILQIGTPSGTMINSSARIEPVAGDAEPINNYSYWEVFSTGSYDPNDITVNRSAIDISEAGNPPYLEYLIRFQNTGTDTAFTVRIENTLPVELNSSTFEYIDGSNDCQISYNPATRTLNFIHNNILLPDSNVNEAASHGYVWYRIKPVSGLSLGAQIPNTAGIYFDFNTVVTTNTAITEIVNPVGLTEISSNNDFISYPNPATGTVMLTFNKPLSTTCNIEILDARGNQVKSMKVGTLNNRISLDMEKLSSGAYFIRVQSQDAVYTGKIIKN